MSLNFLFRRMSSLALVMVITALLLGGPVFAQSDPPRLGEETVAMLESTLVPARDRIDLAQRLLGAANIPEPPTTAPAEYEVGDVVSFWADNLDEDAEFQLDAELVYKTPHIYMFFQVGESVNLDAVKKSADTFENIIYPKVHEVFGSEWSPGIDGDPHLYILHARNLGSWVAAYYGSSSQYPSEAVDTSNEKEMFFVNLDTMDWSVGTEYYEGVLAHEFQHMVHWYVDANEESWLNEGMSELSAMITGYGPSGFASDFLFYPNVQLTTWPEEDDRGIHYGAGFMFVAYFYERYGEEATTALVKNPKNGLTAVKDTLTAIGATDPATGEAVTVVDLYGDWLAANLLQDPSLGDGRYGYVFPAMEGLPTAGITDEIQPEGVPVPREAPQWGPEYLHINSSGAQTLRFTFKGSTTVGLMPVNAHSGEYMWWGNRTDDSDTRLTRTVDLTGVDSATLKYWTWYYIEELWDYGYVMVSTDGGATWTPIETSLMTREDPHSNSYGPGYTAQSGDWVEETVDLTPYTGQEIMIRFEYITDDATTQPGMLIDDVSIPEIGYADDMESGVGDWVTEGWIRTDNILPQDFLVLLVQPGNSAQPVTRLLGPDTEPLGEWEFEVGGEAYIIVSGLAPVTTEAAQYTYTLTPVQ